MAHCSGQCQGEHHYHLGLQMATCLYRSFRQSQAEQQINLVALCHEKSSMRLVQLYQSLPPQITSMREEENQLWLLVWQQLVWPWHFIPIYVAQQT